MVPRGRTRGNGHALKCKRVYQNIRKQFLAVEVTKHWSKLPGGLVDSPSLEILESCLDVILSTQVSVAWLEQELGPDELWRSLPTSTRL